MEDGMQTVTPGASHLEVTPIAYGTWQFGGDWESVDEQAAVAGLVREGLTRHVGVSNYSTDQITEFAAVPPAETVQPPYHLFRRDIEADLLPYARAHHIGMSAYGRWPTATSPKSTASWQPRYRSAAPLRKV
jgi:aryl-alcohol dehydrogenase-like predicted oxidoreductase